jgi:GT2 family glycosyltransferase
LSDARTERFPAVSVIIPNWNGSPFLFELLASLGEAEGREVIVVDNGSSDGSVPMLRDYHPAVRRLELPINEGFSRAVNRGLHLARAPFIAIVNNDTSWTRDWLDPAVAFLEGTPAYDFAAPLVLNYFRRDRVDSAGDGITRSLRPYKRFFDRPSAAIPPGGRDLVATSCSAVVFRRSFFDRVGSFDEDFFMYYEDVDLFFRGLLRGQRGRLLPDLVVYHREGGSIGRWVEPNGGQPGRPSRQAVIPPPVGGESSSLDSQVPGNGKTFLLVRNRVWFLVKNCPAGYLVFAWLLLRSLGWHFVHGSLGTFGRGHRRSLDGLARIRIKRRITQRNRRIPLRRLWQLLG